MNPHDDVQLYGGPADGLLVECEPGVEYLKVAGPMVGEGVVAVYAIVRCACTCHGRRGHFLRAESSAPIGHG
jgi:hypothetical protein